MHTGSRSTLVIYVQNDSSFGTYDGKILFLIRRLEHGEKLPLQGQRDGKPGTPMDNTCLYSVNDC